MIRRTAAVSSLLCALVLCAAAARAHAGTAARKPASHTIIIDGARFAPAELTVNAGDSIVWVNKDIVAHTATSVKAAFDSKVIEPGKSWRYIAKQKGELPYRCSFHPMNGVLRVK